MKFSNRLKEIARCIANAAAREGRPVSNLSIRRDMQEYFLKGLKDEISIRMKNTGADFDTTILEAREIERKLETSEEINYGLNNAKVLLTNEAIIPQTPVESIATNEPLRQRKQCQVCDRIGHEAKECYKVIGYPSRGNYGQRRQSQAYSHQTSPSPAREKKRCFKCNQFGHLKRQCPQYQQPIVNNQTMQSLLGQLQGLLLNNNQMSIPQNAPQNIPMNLLQQIPASMLPQVMSPGNEGQKNDGRTSA